MTFDTLRALLAETFVTGWVTPFFVLELKFGIGY